MRSVVLSCLIACSGSVKVPFVPSAPETEAGSTGEVEAAVPSLGAEVGPMASTNPLMPPAASGLPICPAHALYCDSFETDTLDTNTWEMVGDGKGISIDATTGYDGSRALHAKIGSAYGVSGVQMVHLFKGIATPDDRLYMRLYLRLGALDLPGNHANFVSFYSSDFVASDWTHYARLSIGSNYGHFSVNLNSKGHLDAALRWKEDGQSLHAEEWICLEMMGFGDHQTPNDAEHLQEEIRIWMNGVEIDAMHASDTTLSRWLTCPTCTNVEHWSPEYDGSTWNLGIGGQSSTGPTQDVWFDALAFSHERIGCAP